MTLINTQGKFVVFNKGDHRKWTVVLRRICKRTRTETRGQEDAEIRTGLPGKSGIGWSCSASASVFSSVDPPYGSSSFTDFLCAAAFFCLVSFSTLLQGEIKGFILSSIIPVHASKETTSQLVALQQWCKWNLTDYNYAAHLCLYIHQPRSITSFL